MDVVCVVLWNKEEEERELTFVCGFRCEIVCVFVLSVCAGSAMKRWNLSRLVRMCKKVTYLLLINLNYSSSAAAPSLLFLLDLVTSLSTRTATSLYVSLQVRTCSQLS